MEISWFLPYIVYSTVIGAVIYWYFTKNYGYFKKLGVPYIPAVILFGSHYEWITNVSHEVEVKRYKKYGKIYGSFQGSVPTLTVSDPELIKNILVKDFHIFRNRRDMRVGDRVGDNLLSLLHYEDWKRVRTLISPAFSSGKIKKMMDLVLNSCETLEQNFVTAAKSGKPVNVRSLFGAFTMDVIASAAFATKIDSLNDPENPFVANVRNIFQQNIPWRFVMLLLCPSIMKIFRIPFHPPSCTNFFRNAVLQIAEERRKSGTKKNDFLQLLMDARDRQLEEESLETESEIKENEDYGHEEANKEVFKKVYLSKTLTEDEVFAQCFVFFLAGYHTASLVISLVAYELARHPDIQEKVVSEINEVIRNNKNELTYDSVQKMEYLNKVISETLRLHPPGLRVERTPEEDYKFGDTGIVIPKGLLVGIPVFAIHHDPEYYPEPEKFDPERFSDEEKARRHPYTYLPFGAGPHNCIGMRFALMEIKLCLAYILRRIRFKTCPETKIPLEYYNGGILLAVKDITLEVEVRNEE